MGDADPGLIADACVLIDFQSVDLEVLKIVAASKGPIVVLTTTLREVDGLTSRRCGALGIQLTEPSEEELIAALEPHRGLSLHDRLCVEAAVRRGLRCITNDKLMRKVIQHRGGSRVWSLELLLELVSMGAVPRPRARKIGTAMGRENPGYIGPEVVEEFISKLDGLG